MRKIAALAILVVSSVAATNVAPTKSELEAMYDKAFRAFDANNYPEALKQLDAIDTRQPDLAESQNLRGVIFMRERMYDKAEAALYRAVELDPQFWNARFNLAEIPFLQKNWAEARNRFQGLLSLNSAELQGEAAQLIQYKILLTYVLEEKNDMVDAFLSKFELTNDTPAMQYSKAAVALQHHDEKAAQQWIDTAEKNFSPQLNKLFAESIYEVGWKKKPEGQSRAALELTSAAERAARTKAFAKGKLDEAEEAFQQRDLVKAIGLLDQADAAEADQPASLNLRGEILMEQKEYGKAEDLFKKTLNIDPKYREAEYNLAQVPFKKKEYSKARDRLEALFAATPGGDKNQASQLIKFKIYMTLLLEGKESRAQKMMDQFQFTGDTPALYYAQAAWEFQHDNATKANDWITSARKIYSQGLNVIFADPFYDVGWLKNPIEEPASSLSAVAQNEAAASAAGGNPLIEPSPIPGATSTETASSVRESASVAPSTVPVVTGTEAISSTNAAANVSSTEQTAISGANVPKAPITSPAEEKTAVAAQPVPSPSKAPTKNKAAPVAGAAARVASMPPKVLAPANAHEWTQPTIGASVYHPRDSHTLLVAFLLIAGLGILAWVIVPLLRHRLMPAVSRRVSPATEPPFHVDDVSAQADKVEGAEHPQINVRPPQRSVHLKGTEPSLRRAVFPTGAGKRELIAEPAPVSKEAEPASSEPAVNEPAEAAEPIALEPVAAAEFSAPVEEIVEPSTSDEVEPEAGQAELETVAEPEFEPVTQGRPVPHQMPAMVSEATAKPVMLEQPSAPKFIAPEPIVSQPTTPLMPEPTQTPVIRPTSAAAAPVQTAGDAQNAVQLTFSCEIASMQLTPAFKMSALQVKPISRIVMMRLSPSQRPQPAMNLQITFEVASAESAGKSLGRLRLTPSQQQKPGVITSPAFDISGVQLVSNSESAPVQLTPSQHGKASVHLTAAFQIASVEFSPSLEIASLVLNASSGSVSVQLPGTGPSSVEEAPVFDITGVQMNNGGEIGLIQLAPAGAKAPPQTR